MPIYYTIESMDSFQKQCKESLCEWYATNRKQYIKTEDVFVVWCCKTLQNYKCLVATGMPDKIYAEYTYNGDKCELYEDVYDKLTNRVIKER